MSMVIANTIYDQRLHRLRSVLAALNVTLLPGTLALAKERRSSAKVVEFRPKERLLLCVIGALEGDDLPATARSILDQELARLSEPARNMCAGAAVAWLGASQSHAAAFEIATPREPKLIAASWEPRHLWEAPMPDPEQSPEQALENALTLLQSESARALGDDPSANPAAISGALRLCEACLRWAGGIAPSLRGSLPKDKDQWRTWIDDYLRASRAEQHRLFPSTTPVASPSSEHPVRGVLAGVRVFLSYAMPTNVELARPLRRALQRAGAIVWFDQAERPEQAQLNRGLRKEIAANDVFLLCASGELIENAGYALQELAWVQELSAAGNWAGRVCVVQLDNVLLPRAFVGVPHIDLSGIDLAESPEAVVSLVVAALNTAAPKLPPTDPSRWPVTDPASYGSADLNDLRRRALHTRAWWKFDTTAALREVAENKLNGARSPGFRTATEVAKSLGWDGAVATYDTWPRDPVVRDTRLRFAVLRCLYLCRTMDLDAFGGAEHLRRELEFLALRRPSLLEEPNVAGWDNEERRLAVRHHLGALRCLHDILRPGLGVGVTVNFAEWEEIRWLEGIVERRRDCADCLLELRSARRVRWTGGRIVHWDATFEAIDGFLAGGVDHWDRPVPTWILFGLSCSRLDLAILAADVIWRTSRTQGTEQRSVTIKGSPDFELRVRAKTIDTPGTLDATNRCVTLDATLRTDGTIVLELRWAQPGSGEGHAHALSQVSV